MKIHTSGGDEYQIKKETIETLFASILVYILAEYEKLPDNLKLLAMALTRGILLVSELKESDPEKKAQFRPAKRGDPNLHLISFLIGRLTAILPALEIEVEADEARCISGVSLKNSDSGGGPLFAHGGFGQRQDDGGETAGQTLSAVVSDASALHIGQQA